MTDTDSETRVDMAQLVPLEVHCEWTRSSIGDSYVHVLGEPERAELHEALGHATSRHDDVLSITAADFPLPTLSTRLAAIAEDLVNGRGVALIRGVERARYTAEEASLIYWGIGSHLGRPWPQNAKGHLLGDVTDQGKRYDDPTSRGNELGGVGLPFHSDGSDLVGLFCLDDGASEPLTASKAQLSDRRVHGCTSTSSNRAGQSGDSKSRSAKSRAAGPSRSSSGTAGRDNSRIDVPSSMCAPSGVRST